MSGLLACACVAGCATSGKNVLLRNGAVSIERPNQIAIELSPDLRYWWGPWEPDLKFRVRDEMGRVFRRAGFAVVEQDADLVLKITQIDTGGWTGGIVIGRIVVEGFEHDRKTLTVSYEQHTDAFTLRSFLQPSRGEAAVAYVLARRVIGELRIRKIGKTRTGCGRDRLRQEGWADALDRPVRPATTMS